MANYKFLLIFALVCGTSASGNNESSILDDVWCFTRRYGGAVALGAGAVALAPVAVGALGFTSAGIVAGSTAAKLMAISAAANGGGVAAGSAVAILQSVGAAGLGLGAKVGIVTTTAATYSYLTPGCSSEDVVCTCNNEEKHDSTCDNEGKQ